jgi:hypothetical protein
VLWTKATISGMDELRAVWADQTGIAYAVGSGGNIRRYANGAWTTMESPTNNELYCVWGASSSDVYAGGQTGRFSTLTVITGEA